MHIWLIGMMGVGKTTIGALVAERLALPLVDTDAEVMRSTGRTIPEIFAESEQAFRSAESSVIASLVDAASSVVSTGGGAILDPGNTATMHATGTVVLLEASVADLRNRILPGRERPLVGSADDIARIAADRHALYVAAADHRVTTDGRSPGEIAAEVVACLDM